MLNSEFLKTISKHWYFRGPLELVGLNLFLRLCDRWRLHIFRNGKYIENIFVSTQHGEGILGESSKNLAMIKPQKSNSISRWYEGQFRCCLCYRAVGSVYAYYVFVFMVADSQSIEGVLEKKNMELCDLRNHGKGNIFIENWFSSIFEIVWCILLCVG